MSRFLAPDANLPTHLVTAAAPAPGTGLAAAGSGAMSLLSKNDLTPVDREGGGAIDAPLQRLPVPTSFDTSLPKQHTQRLETETKTATEQKTTHTGTYPGQVRVRAETDPGAEPAIPSAGVPASSSSHSPTPVPPLAAAGVPASSVRVLEVLPAQSPAQSPSLPPAATVAPAPPSAPTRAARVPAKALARVHVAWKPREQSLSRLAADLYGVAVELFFAAPQGVPPSDIGMGLRIFMGRRVVAGCKCHDIIMLSLKLLKPMHRHLIFCFVVWSSVRCNIAFCL
jgi:hypothetical protein